MTYLLDTHVLVVGGGRATTVDAGNSEPFARSRHGSDVQHGEHLGQVVIKSALGRSDFRVDPRQLRDGLLRNGYGELAIRSDHTLGGCGQLPPIHNDPFDRILVAQAQVENITLLTMDAQLARYPVAVRSV